MSNPNSENFDQIDGETVLEEINALGKSANFSIEPIASKIDFEDKSKYTRLKIDDIHKSRIDSLLQFIPALATANTAQNVYVVSFPLGAPHTLVALEAGGYSSMIRDWTSTKFRAHASFYPIAAQTAALGAFNAMSAVTGQYFLANINRQLLLVNTKLEEILNFLYGENHAELVAEIEFIRFVNANFSSIMMSSEQRIATITGLQQAQKIATKDVEFYLTDLDRLAKMSSTGYEKLCEQMDNILRTVYCIELAKQALITAFVLELHVARNYDKSYIQYLEKRAIANVNRCDNSINSSLSGLLNDFRKYRPKPLEKTPDKEEREKRLEGKLDEYLRDTDSPIRTALKEALATINKPETYYLDPNGAIYIKNT